MHTMRRTAHGWLIAVTVDGIETNELPPLNDGENPWKVFRRSQLSPFFQFVTGLACDLQVSCVRLQPTNSRHRFFLGGRDAPLIGYYDASSFYFSEKLVRPRMYQWLEQWMDETPTTWSQVVEDAEQHYGGRTVTLRRLGATPVLRVARQLCVDTANRCFYEEHSLDQGSATKIVPLRRSHAT
jgi:hypothetical protein